MSNIIYIGALNHPEHLRDSDAILDFYIPMPTYQRVTLDNGVKVYTMILKNGSEFIVAAGTGAVRPLSYAQKTVIARRWVTYTEVEQWVGRE
jgi:hypothetical protein